MNMFIKTMPKVIDEVEKKILTSAGKLLKTKLSSFSLRAVAGDCGIAVGTIYNYFPNKEYLTAAVFAEDWNVVLSATRRRVQGAASPTEGIMMIAEGLRHFRRDHEKIWNALPAGAGTGSTYSKGHRMLCEQISGLIRERFLQSGLDCPEASAILTAEVIIAAVQHPEISDDELRTFLKHLIQGGNH